MAGGLLQISLRSRLLPEVHRDVRPRISLLSESNLNELLNKLNGREQSPGYVRKHISVRVENLTRKVDMSEKLLAKQ